MHTFFLAVAVLGGLVLALQLVLGLFGLDHHDGGGLGLHPGGDLGGALELLSIRALGAGATFFGLAGLGALQAGLGPALALPAAAAAGLAAASAIAALTRWMLRMESDGTVRLDAAVGHSGQVYLSIPGGRDAAGKVHLTLQGRTVECRALSDGPLPTGSPVLVVDVLGPDTVEVVPSPLLRIADGNAAP